MSPRDHADKRAVAFRKVRRITGSATGGAALTAAVLGGLVANEIPGATTVGTVAVHATSSTATSPSTTLAGGSGSGGSTATTAAPTTTTTAPTVVSGGTSSS